MTNNVKKIEDNFVNALGSGAGASKALLGMIEAVVVSRDATVLSRAIMRAENKGDTSAASLVRFVVGQVWKGAKIARNKDKKLSIKIKGISACDDTLARLRGAVERNLSLRHATFRKVVRGDEGKSGDKEFDVKAWASQQAKKHNRAEIDAMIAALQAFRNDAAS